MNKTKVCTNTLLSISHSAVQTVISFKMKINVTGLSRQDCVAVNY